MSGWKTLVISGKKSLCIQNGQLIIGGETEEIVPLHEIRQILIDSLKLQMSASTLVHLSSNNISIVVCNEKHNPAGIVLPIGVHHASAKVVMEQASWKDTFKDQIWAEIVRLKLRNQWKLLLQLGLAPSPKMKEYSQNVENGDTTNREAVGAKLYFSTLFGKGFKRHEKDSINATLNYGYTILLSAFNRVLASHGYHSGLGIHHCSDDNPFNLACDLMEPFRPLVDRIAYMTKEMPLDWDKKKTLIGIPYMKCMLDGKQYQLGEAMDYFTVVLLDALRRGHTLIPEVCFE